MKHYSEHVLHLYVLGAPEVSKSRGAINAHLEKCKGCRSLVERIEGFTAELEGELKREEFQQGDTWGKKSVWQAARFRCLLDGRIHPGR